MKMPMRYIVILLLLVCSKPESLWAQIDDSVAIEAVAPEAVAPEKSQAIFDTILASDKLLVSAKKLDSTLLDSLRAEEDFWYVNTAPPPPKPLKERKNTTSGWLSNALWAFIIGGFIIFLIWFILSSDIRLFRKPARSSKNKLATPSVKNEPEEVDFEKQIALAIQSGNYRLATRLLYLQVLQVLSEKKLIQYQQQRTNADYLAQLYGSNYYSDFFRLTRHFEYSWYGLFDLQKNMFLQVQQEFSNFKKRLAE